MPLRVQCSAGHLMMVPDHRAGTTLRCPKCGIDVQVPAAGGIAGKEAGKVRLATPTLGRSESKPGSSARQSAQVAGHTTAAKSGIGLPTLGKNLTAAPRSKPPPLPAAAKRRVEAEQPQQQPVIDAPPAPATAPKSEGRPEPEIIFTSQVLVAPRPLAEPPPLVEPPLPVVVHQADVETVDAPPKKLAPVMVTAPSEEPPIAASPPQKFQPHEPELDPGPPRTQPPRTFVLGVRPTSSQRTTAWQLAAALIAAALLSIGPSVWEIADYLNSDGTVAVARWAFLLLVLGVVQAGCIALLAQVPDWSSVWIVTLQSLTLAAIYAAVLGLTVITKGDSPLIAALQIQEQYTSGKAAMWCVCLAATYACLAFFAGRVSAKWRKVLRQIHAADQAAIGPA